MIKLDLGCGISKKPGYLGVDALALPNVDIVHNLNVFPYPFHDSEVDEIWMDQVLEHVENPLKVMEELFRISKNKAPITIGVPYFRSFYATIDPTHRHFFGVHWFDYFDPRHIYCKKYQYTHAQFMVKKIEFDRESSAKTRNPLKKGLLWLATRYPHRYESRISHLFPLNSLTFYLEVSKPAP